MAARGPKPKPPALRLVTGSHRTARHGKIAETKANVEQSVASFGKLAKPTYLKGKAAEAWKEFIEPAGWLDGASLPAAVAFCELWAEFRMSPVRFVAARHTQMRGYMADLGLTDPRARGDDGKKSSNKNEFFD